MRQVQDAVSRMENTQGSTLEKLGLALKAELGRMVQEQLSEARPMKGVVPSPHDDSRTRREAETLEATVKNLQKYLVGQLRNLLTTSAQDQGSAGKIQSNPATQGYRQSDRVTSDRKPSRESSGVINERTSAGRMGQDMKNTDEFLASKLQETLNAAKAEVKAEPVLESKSPAPTRSTSSRVSGWPSSGTSKSPEPRRRESLRKRKSGKSRRHGNPSDSGPSSDSSSESDSSNRSDSSSFGDTTPGVTTKTAEGGTTVYTFKPFVNSNTLEDFDPKASLATRIRWLERFQSMTTQGGWTDQVKAYEMKLKMPAPVWNWETNLELKVRRDWKRFLKALRERYCKAKTSDSERYYTMIQKKSETPLEFYYRLNKVAEEAGLDFKSSRKARERHLNVFMKKLLDTRLRSTLQGQRIRSLKDVKYVLKQHEDMAQDDDYDTPPVKRDFRADNVSHGHFHPKRRGRAFVVQNEDESSDDDKQVRFHDAVEDIPTKSGTLATAASTGSVSTGSSMSRN
ncbi:hypothetical protein PHYSODRAFT_332759 [Phytophthora sojae]|uniref:Retrotransposon gag domain-containing protein n=1 Tax=Phytophthora sojae (strain P6497) TaxID=1094619 RepID=G4ZEJ8_PHYSP|nr:hypothetical protein PHYSODRAFT_332759 [Phytophthora sojae]EGZ19053.1 hypothetical protein PHYSODRAFT_332759 [Phytophthora sojae]|eukprot:XP_009528111.1 hypothetical protein PHYSODRAFT_332759 [Phytophthora sojae]